MDEKFVNILENAARLFIKYGIKSVTMDDISKEFGISKKTLYQYVSDKNELVEKVVFHYVSKQRSNFEVIINKEQNSIDTLLDITENLSKLIQELNPSVFNDLQKYHPEALKKLNEYRKTHILENIQENIKKGIDEGFYRKELRIDIISKLYVALMEIIFNPDIFPSYNFKEQGLIKEIIMYHIRAIATPKGIEYLKGKYNY